MLISFGFIEGIILSFSLILLSNFFVSKSFFHGSIFFVILGLIASFWGVPKLFEGNSGILKVRIMLVGIGLASFVDVSSYFVDVCTKRNNGQFG